MLKNRPVLIAVMALAVISGVSTVIFLEESVSDGVDAEHIEIENIESSVPEAYLTTVCDGLPDSDRIEYRSVELLDYSITTGKLLEVCVEPNYKWFTIYLRTEGPGSLIVTIPKNIVDLRQFDYESCNDPSYFYTNIKHDRNTVITQIAKTDTSRTLQFTWNEPIKHLEYFGGHAIIDGVDYSGPNHCIVLVENGLQSAELVVKKEKTTEEHFERMCKNYDSEIYNDMEKLFNIPNDSVKYEITGGKLLGILYEKSVDGYVIFIDATEDGLLVITIPNPLPSESPYGDNVSLDIDNAILLVNSEIIEFDKITTTEGDTTYSIPFSSCGQVIEIFRNYYFP